MNPQPVSLADELRGLTGKMEHRVKSHMSRPHRGRPAQIAGWHYYFDEACDRCQLEALLDQHAAEQPKLTEGSVCAILLEEMASVERDGLSAVELNRITERLNALLTSPVAPPPNEIEQPILMAFADKLEAAIKARDFRDDWGPFDVQQSCSEMVHEQLAEFCGSPLPQRQFDENAILSGRIAEAAWWSARAEEAGVLKEWTLGPGRRLASLAASIPEPVAPPVAPGEQPPRTPMTESVPRYHCTFCDGNHDEGDCPNRCTPPAQERASAKSTLVDIMVGNTWEQSVAAFERALATAAKLAREEALKEADRVSEEVGLEYFSRGDKAGWAACDDVGHKLRALAAQPSPQTKEEEK